MTKLHFKLMTGRYVSQETTETSHEELNKKVPINVCQANALHCAW